MKKIVIFSKQPENNDGLIKLVNALFPECEICLDSINKKDLHQDQRGSASRLDLRKGRERNGTRDFDRR